MAIFVFHHTTVPPTNRQKNVDLKNLNVINMNVVNIILLQIGF